MKNIIRVISVLIAFLFVGCAAALNPRHFNLAADARYAENKAYLEARIKDMDQTPLKELYFLCDAYSNLKEYDKLFPCVESLQRRIDSGDDHIYYFDFSAQPAFMLSMAHMELGQFEKAVEQAELAYGLVDKKNLSRTDRIKALSTLGMAYSLAGQTDKAEKVAAELDDLYMGYPHNLLKDQKHEGLARIYFSLKQYQKAVDAATYLELNPIAHMAKGIAGKNIFTHQVVPREFIQYKSLMEIGKTDEAKQGFDKLLKIEQAKSLGGIYWQILFARGRIARDEGKTADAVTFLKEAVNTIEQQRSTIHTEASKIGFVGDKQKVYEYLIETLLEQNRFAEAFEYVERGKARALVDMLAAKKTFAGRSKDGQKVADLIQELDKADEMSIAAAYNLPPGKKGENIRTIKRTKEKIAGISTELASLVTVTPLQVNEIQSILPADETLIEYYYHGEDIFAFVVTSKSVKGMKIDGQGINAAVKAYRTQIFETLDATRSITKNYSKPGQASQQAPAFAQLSRNGENLYQRLFNPLETMIHTKNVTIVPHGALHYMPFNALIAEGEYLIDKYNLRVLPSASVMKFIKTRRQGQIGNLLVFGNPDLDDAKYDLPFAQEEALALKTIQTDSKVLLKKEATETAVKKYGGQFKQVHFACHGTFNPEKPLDSGLLLSQDGQNNGMLTVGELYDMRLNADLVTLSACETALGKIANGDDVIGFTRGFLYAGTSSIVSSLWQVDDKATSMLMQAFYRNLKTEDKRIALRKAQLKIKNEYNSHPFFWAAFQLTGAVK